MVNKWLKIGHDWLLPHHCLLCLGAATRIDLCSGCRHTLPRIQNPCSGCGVPLHTASRCLRCLKSPPPFDRVRIPYLYAGPASALIHALKFRRRLAAATVLGNLLAEHVEGEGLCRPQCLVPVPLHPNRQRERGFNQSLEIARPLAARLDIPIAPRLAKRIRPTAAQSSLQDADARRRNLRGAFSADSRACGPMDHVAIVDDVVTTAATAIALTVALKGAGVTRVELWSVARAGES